MKTFVTFILFILLVPLASGQVQVNINFHQLEDIRIGEIKCSADKKDLILDLTAQTFVTQPSFIRYELLQLEKEKRYSLIHNSSHSAVLSDENPSFLLQIRPGELEHHFILRSSQSSKLQCSRFKELIRVTVEPM